MALRSYLSTLGLAIAIASPFAAQAIGCAEGEAIDPDALHDPSGGHAGAGGKSVSAGSGGSTSLPAGGSSGMPDTQAGGSANEGGNTGSGGTGNATDSGTPGSGGSTAGSAGSGGTGNMPMDAAIIPPDAPLAKGVVVLYHNGSGTSGDDHINFYFRIVNNGTTAIPLSALKIRYYLTDELNGAGMSSIYESFVAAYPNETTRVNYAPPITKETVTRVALANSYLEFTVNSTDQLQAGYALTMQVAYAATGGQPLDETNDYSANLTQTTYAQTMKMVVFQGNTVIAGAAAPY